MTYQLDQLNCMAGKDSAIIHLPDIDEVTGRLPCVLADTLSSVQRDLLQSTNPACMAALPGILQAAEFTRTKKVRVSQATSVLLRDMSSCKQSKRGLLDFLICTW